MRSQFYLSALSVAASWGSTRWRQEIHLIRRRTSRKTTLTLISSSLTCVAATLRTMVSCTQSHSSWTGCNPTDKSWALRGSAPPRLPKISFATIPLSVMSFKSWPSRAALSITTYSMCKVCRYSIQMTKLWQLVYLPTPRVTAFHA